MEEKLIELYKHLYNEGAFFFEQKMPTSFENKKSAVVELDNDFAVFIDAKSIETIAEETELVAHECGHVATGTTHKVTSTCDIAGRHERLANKWAVHEVLPFADLQEAFKAGCRENWEFAEYLGRTEQFVSLAVDIYRTEGLDINTDMYPGLKAAGG